jgi:hypothetical protein
MLVADGVITGENSDERRAELGDIIAVGVPLTRLAEHSLTMRRLIASFQSCRG